MTEFSVMPSIGRHADENVRQYRKWPPLAGQAPGDAFPSGLTMDRPGHTNGLMDDVTATDVCELFPAVYVRFCRRQDRRETRLTPQMDAVLLHLAMSGPLTVGEMADHFSRAQSVVSEIVTGMEKKGMLERMRDERDRRRTLVWLTDRARALLARRHQVLDPARVARAMARMSEGEREGLVEGMRALVRAAEAEVPERGTGTKERRTR
jgi:DNA-binding MarR family transcriptional regulator